METFFTTLGDEVQDVYEETFHLFSQNSALQDLGMLDPKTTTLDLTIAGRDFTITQSPGALQSNRTEGTTGAAVWQTSVRVAEWLSVLFTGGVLGSSSTVLELGSGISGIIPCILAPKVGTVIATDQQHLLKIMRENITANTSQTRARSSKHTVGKPIAVSSHATNIRVIPLDWEEDDVQNVLSSSGLGAIDVVFASDCIYNYALIEPLMQTCLDICKLRSPQSNDGGHYQAPTMCVIAQQLRQAEVFEQWLQTTLREFRVWRVPDEMLTDGLAGGSGFAVHVCILRGGQGERR
ncbi:hypothetical protein LTR08_000006 [Meristemomyces frigidus]|nr:hypothetical protein LTR08_000006 [Meristemomyces frigidus]